MGGSVGMLAARSVGRTMPPRFPLQGKRALPMPTPVVFIHGLWLHATSWQPWIDLFTDKGYAPQAPGWPGDPDTVEAARQNPDAIANRGINEVTGAYADLVSELDEPPILIGHSFGGLIVEKLLGQGLGKAA